MAIPVGSLGEARTLGPVLRAGLVFGAPTRDFQARLEVEGAWMPGDRGASTLCCRARDFESLGAFGMLAIGPETRIAPYVIIGGGFQWLRVQGVTNPYGTTGGVRGGVGVRGQLRGMLIHLEITPHANLTDFGAGEYDAGVFLPLVAGIRF